jgi:hypothetical protein
MAKLRKYDLSFDKKQGDSVLKERGARGDGSVRN